MKNNARCFILTPDGYEEITYTALQERRDADPGYLERRFVPLHGMLMEVSPDDYREFYRDVERKKYLRREAKRADEVYYNALDTEEMSGEDIIVDRAPLPDETVTDRLMVENLLSCLGRLGEDDRALLTALYYDGKSETEIAASLGITQQAVSKRLHKVIRKLRSMMGI